MNMSEPIELKFIFETIAFLLLATAIGIYFVNKKAKNISKK